MPIGKYIGDSYEKRRQAALKGLANKSKEARNNSLKNLSQKGRHHSKETKLKISRASKETHKRLLASGKEFDRRKKISLTEKKTRNSKKAKVWLSEAGKKISNTKRNWSKQTKAKVYSKTMRNKISKWSKSYWKSLSTKEKEKRLKRFMDAPNHRALPNKVETNVINLNIKNLFFTGDGTYWTTLGKNRKKNPDFIINKSKNKKRTKGVVEIMDFEYWHTRQEASYITKLYKEKNIKCLIINAKKCYYEKDLEKVKLRIENFIKLL